MNAKEARRIAFVAIQKNTEEESDRVRLLVSDMLRRIKLASESGQTSMLFSVYGATKDSDTQLVKDELVALGYSFSNESDNGLKYEMVCW